MDHIVYRRRNRRMKDHDIDKEEKDIDWPEVRVRRDIEASRAEQFRFLPLLGPPIVS